MPTHTMNIGSMASGGIGRSISTSGSTTLRTGARVPGRQAERHAEGSARAEADRHPLERRGHVDPELARRPVPEAAEDEPRPGKEDRVEESQGHDEAGESAPQCQESENGADPERERAAALERGPSQARLHQRGHVAHD